MSWFKHSPPKHPPPIKHHVQHHRRSPASQRIKEEAKATGPALTNKKDQAPHN
jgi:hypothetical protein